MRCLAINIKTKKIYVHVIQGNKFQICFVQKRKGVIANAWCETKRLCELISGVDGLPVMSHNTRFIPLPIFSSGKIQI